MIVTMFFVVSLLAIVSAVMVISLRNPMHCTLALFGFFLAVASLFVLLNAEFVAVIQLFVYAGGILVLYIFVIMFVSLDKAELEKRRFHRQKAAAVLFGVLLLLAFLVKLIPSFRLGPSLDNTPDKIIAAGGYVKAVGAALLVDYVVPFELASLVLLVAMLGAVVLGRVLRRQGKEQN